MKYGFRWLVPLLAFMEGCSLPPVNLATPKPMQVDIKMRVDVYQYAANNNASEGKKNSKEKTTSAEETLRSNRRADIQAFKNAQYVGEGHEGLLRIRKEQPGDLGDRIRKTVEAENADRSTEMTATSQKEKIPLSEVQNRQGEANRIRAFKGEWIEKPQPNGTFIWAQKEVQ